MSSFPIHYHDMGVSSASRFSDYTAAGSVYASPKALRFTILHEGTLVTLLPNEVVRIYTERPYRGVVIDHIAFEKIGTLEISPVGISPEQLIAGIRSAGFIPKATPVREWDPTLGPPPEE